MFLFAPIRWALRIPSMLIFGALVYVVTSGIQVVTASRQAADPSSSTRAAAVVVLPAPLLQGSAPSPDLVARLQEALALSQAGVAPKVIVAGAPAKAGATSPASVAKAWLVARGVPASTVLTLSTRTSTATLSAVAAVVGTPATIVAVTDAMDALFTRGAAASDQLTAIVAPAVGSTSISATDFGPLWRQATGVAVGRVIGYSRATWAGG